MPTRSRWQQVEELFHAALERPIPERGAFLDAACEGDETLRAEVEEWIENDAKAVDLVDRFSPFGTGSGGDSAGGDDPLVGRSVGRYRLVAKVAAGGMGVVYRGVRDDDLFEHDVAIKLIRAEAATDEMRRRFDFERRTLASLTHPNIARLYDGGTTGEGTPYLVMEFIHGVPIDRYCDEQQLSIPERLRLFVSVCRAVHFAHQNLIVHRDLKPGNVLVDEQGVPKLVDFGIARLLSDSDEAFEPTLTQGRILTPEYASPEQLRGQPVTTSSDVYSLGIVLYGLLTGRKPYRCKSRSPAEWERVVTEQEPVRPSTAVLEAPSADGTEHPTAEQFAARFQSTTTRLRRTLRGDLDRIVLMALRKEPERRYASVQQFADDIERYLSGHGVIAREATVFYRTRTFVRRNRLAVSAASLVMVAFAGGFVSTFQAERRATREAAHARVEAQSFQDVANFLISTFLTSTRLGNRIDREAAHDAILRQAEAIRRQHRDENHLRANLLDALGTVCVKLELFDSAGALIQEAMEIRRNEFGERSLEMALSLGSWGTLSYEQGRFDDAVDALRRALDLHRTCPPGVHTDVATAANDLACALRLGGWPREAEPLHREALALRMRTYGPRSLEVAESLNNLAGVYLGDEDFETADELLTTAFEIRRAILGTEQILTLQTLSNLSITAFRLGRSQQSHDLLREAADGFRALRAEGREGLGRTLGNLATLELQLGDLDGAERALTEALQIQVDRLGPDHADVATLHVRIADLHWRRNRNDLAQEAWNEVLRIRRAVFPERHPKLAETYADYGGFLHDTGRFDEAEPTFREALSIRREALDPDHPAIGESLGALGICLARMGRLDEAEALLRECMDRFERAPGSDSLGAARHREELQKVIDELRTDGASEQP